MHLLYNNCDTAASWYYVQILFLTASCQRPPFSFLRGAGCKRETVLCSPPNPFPVPFMGREVGQDKERSSAWWKELLGFFVAQMESVLPVWLLDISPPRSWLSMYLPQMPWVRNRSFIVLKSEGRAFHEGFMTSSNFTQPKSQTIETQLIDILVLLDKKQPKGIQVWHWV